MGYCQAFNWEPTALLAITKPTKKIWYVLRKTYLYVLSLSEEISWGKSEREKGEMYLLLSHLLGKSIQQNCFSYLFELWNSVYEEIIHTILFSQRFTYNFTHKWILFKDDPGSRPSSFELRYRDDVACSLSVLRKMEASRLGYVCVTIAVVMPCLFTVDCAVETYSQLVLFLKLYLLLRCVILDSILCHFLLSSMLLAQN